MPGSSDESELTEPTSSQVDREVAAMQDVPGILLLSLQKRLLMTFLYYTEHESMYNDGQGIHYLLKFQAMAIAQAVTTPAPKQRLNAHPALMNTTFYAFETEGLAEIIDKALSTVKRPDLAEKFKIVAGDLWAPAFSLDYSIAYTSYKNISLSKAQVYDEMLQQLASKRKSEITLAITEKQAMVCIATSLRFYLML